MSRAIGFTGRAGRRFSGIQAGVLSFCAAALLVAPPAGAQGGAPEETAGSVRQPAQLRTAAERSGFARHSSHDEMMAYLVELGRHADDMHLGEYGRSVEGRGIPWLLFSRPSVTTPAEAHASGLPIVVLGANVHGYNYILREALLIFARELATRGTPANDLLDDVIVLVVPSKNPDGVELGTRFNARGADMNRDYMTLDEPETAAFVARILNPWEPHLVLTGHDGGAAQYGGAHPYHLLYQGPGLAGADPALIELGDASLLPWLTDHLASRGYRAFYWSRGEGDRWLVGGSSPRMERNYVGLSDRMAVLFEVAEWPEMEEAVDVALEGARAMMTYAVARRDELLGTVREARRRTLALGPGGADAGAATADAAPIPVEERMEVGPRRASWEVRDPEREGELIRIDDGELVNLPAGTRFRDRPWAWVLPPEADDAVALLRRHGIRMARLAEPVDARVTAYTIDEVRWDAGESLHRSSPRIIVGDEVEIREELPAGSWIIEAAQPLGRVAAHLLEVETSDNLIGWGRMTHLLPPEAFLRSDAAGSSGAGSRATEAGGMTGAGATLPIVPILKLMERIPLPTLPEPSPPAT